MARFEVRASLVPAICRTSSYIKYGELVKERAMSVFDVPVAERETTPAMLEGTMMEPVIIKRMQSTGEFSDSFEIDFINEKQKLYARYLGDDIVLTCHPDGVITEIKTKEKILFECKNKFMGQKYPLDKKKFEEYKARYNPQILCQQYCAKIYNTLFLVNDNSSDIFSHSEQIPFDEVVWNQIELRIKEYKDDVENYIKYIEESTDLKML